MDSRAGADHLKAALGPDWLVEVHATLPSTMDRARDVPATPALIIALHQSAGRGRQGRVWEDNATDFSGTFVFSREVEIARLMGFSLAVGVTVHRALGLSLLKLKWPNDLYTADGRKLGGILIEVVQDPSPRVLVGIGCNLGLPKPLSGRASLQELSTEFPTPFCLAQKLAAPLRSAWHNFQAHGFTPFRADFLANAYGLGHQVIATEGTQRIEGVISGVDEQGCLLVDTPSALHRLVNAHIEEIKRK